MHPDPDVYAALIAAVIQTAVSDTCHAALGRGRGPAWARAHLADDISTARWAESIGVAWPPDIRILADIISAIGAGETVWVSRTGMDARLR